MFFTSNGGRLASQLPFLACSSSEVRMPCSANWRTATQMFHCIAAGGLPPAMRFRAAACSACGPTDALSTQVPPRLLYSLAKTATARDSPPLVHQCITSAFCALACEAESKVLMTTEAVTSDFLIALFPPWFVYDSDYIRSSAIALFSVKPSL